MPSTSLAANRIDSATACQRRTPPSYASPRNHVILIRVMPARVKAAASATNPFRFGRIVSGDAFTDREADLRALERELRGGQNILIEAPRRFGKTSLILEVKRHLEAAGIPVAYLDCMLVPSRARLADRLASAYLDAFKHPAQRAEDWVVQHLKAFRVRPTLTLERGPRVALIRGRQRRHAQPRCPARADFSRARGDRARGQEE